MVIECFDDRHPNRAGRRGLSGFRGTGKLIAAMFATAQEHRVSSLLEYTRPLVDFQGYPVGIPGLEMDDPDTLACAWRTTGCMFAFHSFTPPAAMPPVILFWIDMNRAMTGTAVSMDADMMRSHMAFLETNSVFSPIGKV